MNRLHRTALATALVAAPLLLAAGEVTRKSVESVSVDSDDLAAAARSKLEAVAADLAMWHVHGALVLVGAVAWLGAVVGILTLLHRGRPVAALVGGTLGLAAGVGYGLHLGFYTTALSGLASMPATDLDAAVTVWAAGDADPFGLAMVAFFIITSVCALLVLGYGLWRARVIPWWAVALLPVWAVLSLEPGSSPLWGLLHLLWAPAFVMAARGVLTGSSVVVTDLEPLADRS